MFEVRAGDLVAQLGGELLGDPALPLRGIASLESAGPGDISFLSNPRYLPLLQQSAAGCVIVPEAQREAAAGRGSVIVCKDPYLYYALITQWWAKQVRVPPPPGVHSSAVVEAGAQLDPTASIGPLAYVADGARIGPGVVIGPQCHVGAGADIGAHTRLAAQVVVGQGCRIGERCILHAGVVIGADGFGFAPTRGRWEKIEQLGAVRIGDDVEIGANSCVDRGALQDTVLEQGVKLDNLVHIAHNVVVGAHTAMAACVGIAGSTRIGAHCTFAGQAGVVGHVQICDHVHIGAACAVTRSITKPGSYGGMFPFDENGVWDKNAATLRQLYALRGRVRALESKSQ
jgi:UDP-3-O-[3-hydroxymyristoyl] glucosamine N-acyltransferase